MSIMKTALGVALALILTGGIAQAQTPPFGSDNDAAYAAQLWKIMGEQNLVGKNELMTKPYEGTEPHGAVLEAFFSTAKIGNHNGRLIVKRNYGPKGVDPEVVLKNPAKHLGSITVMYQRKEGYDPDNQNWFWVKFNPDGSLAKNGKGMRLAGRVAKGKAKGCIACHVLAGDYIYTTDSIGQIPE